MRVKEMHPLCCISLESPGIGKHSPEREPAALFRTSSLPAAGSHGNAAQGSETTVAGVLYKWTNYGKGWRSRWFLLRNGVLSYAKIRCPENLNLLTPSDDVRLIGEISTNRLARVDSAATVTRRKHRKASSSSSSGVVHLKVPLYLPTHNELVDFALLYYLILSIQEINKGSSQALVVLSDSSVILFFQH